MNSWFIYILETAAGAFYTGITTDVQRRLAEHQAGGKKAARSLRGKGPLQLVYKYKATGRSEALKLEAQIKKLSHKQKALLVEGQNEPGKFFCETGNKDSSASNGGLL